MKLDWHALSVILLIWSKSLLYKVYWALAEETSSLIMRSSPTIFFIRFERHCFHCNLIRKNSNNESTPLFFSGTLKYNGFVCIFNILTLTLLWLRANVAYLIHSCSHYIPGLFLLVLLNNFQQIQFLKLLMLSENSLLWHWRIEREIFTSLASVVSFC